MKQIDIYQTVLDRKRDPMRRKGKAAKKPLALSTNKGKRQVSGRSYLDTFKSLLGGRNKKPSGGSSGVLG